MTERSFILAPKIVSVEFQNHPAYSLLNTLGMLMNLEDYPGVDGFLVQLGKKLPPEVLQANNALMEVAYSLLFGLTSDILELQEYIDLVAITSPDVLQDIAINGFLDDTISEKHPNVTKPAREDFLNNLDIALDYVRSLHHDKGIEYDDEPFKQGYRLIQNPYLLQRTLVNHLTYMWENHLKPSWERVLPIIEETVQAFQQLDYSGMSGIEAGRIVTGRDMSNTWIGEAMEKAERMIFVPSPYIGPYVGAFHHQDKTLYIFFRPHLPEGTTQKASPALNRSELLVRLSALADDSRLRILELFKEDEELCAQDIIQLLDLSQSAASRHLRQLTATGYLTERRKEGAKCYRLNQDRVTNTLQAVQTFLSIH